MDTPTGHDDADTHDAPPAAPEAPAFHYVVRAAFGGYHIGERIEDADVIKRLGDWGQLNAHCVRVAAPEPAPEPAKED